YGRDHLVAAPLEPAEHPERVGAVGGLLQHLPVYDTRAVRSQDETPGNARCLLPREALSVALGRLTRGADLGDMRGPDLDRNAEHLEQLAPPGGPRRQYQHRRAHADRSRMSVTGPSLRSSTSIIAPNSPVWTSRPRARSAATKAS